MLCVECKLCSSIKKDRVVNGNIFEIQNYHFEMFGNLTWLYFFVEKAADSPYTVHDRMVYVFIHQNTALVYCVKSLGYVFLWRYVIVFMLLFHKELFTVFEFNFSMISDVLLSKCVLINCQIYKSEMYHVYEL